MPIKPSRGIFSALLGVVVLAAGLVTADLVVTHLEQDKLSAQIRCKLAGSPKVDVSLGGGLLAPAVVVGQPVNVRITATGVQAADVSADVNVSLEQVRVKHSDGSTTVSTGPGSVDGVVGFDSLSQVSGVSSGQKVTLRAYGDELVASVAGTGLLGSLQMLMRVAAQPRSLTLTPTALLLGNREIPLATARSLAQSSGGAAAEEMLQPRTIALSKLRAGVSLTSASVGETGLWISAHIDPLTVALAGQGLGCGSARR